MCFHVDVFGELISGSRAGFNASFREIRTYYMLCLNPLNFVSAHVVLIEYFGD